MNEQLSLLNTSEPETGDASPRGSHVSDEQIASIALSGSLRNQHYDPNSPVSEAAADQGWGSPAQEDTGVADAQSQSIEDSIVAARAALGSKSGKPRLENGARHATRIYDQNRRNILG